VWTFLFLNFTTKIFSLSNQITSFCSEVSMDRAETNVVLPIYVLAGSAKTPSSVVLANDFTGWPDLLSAQSLIKISLISASDGDLQTHGFTKALPEWKVEVSSFFLSKN
jgi:hypothetical protein